ncbi:GNAT family N-acetyltransferase [Paenibacillus sp. SYP-B4298]|uniref:GNAT family N-acetyltransferase n=1 Tax=Paenibacillus sp. SYP-B4298 TaxID=2996034 RepID=UPI0022DCE7F0|nr:GNAT family N-acetyltransferase [Paenibacillus sp. SYP-B4298]
MDEIKEQLGAGDASSLSIQLITGERWVLLRPRLLAFLARVGDKRITVAALAALRQLEPRQLAAPGYAVAAALEQGRLVGFAAALQHGQEACLLAVHPQYRGRGIGSLLLQAMLRRCGWLQGEVALDNTSSLAACFRCGMKAVALLRGPTGKPTLRMEGAWQPGSRRIATLEEEGTRWQSPSSGL